MPRVVHFEIHATEPERLIAFYSGLFGWTFTKAEGMDYWLIGTGAPDEPGIDGGLVKRPVPGPADSPALNAFPCTVQVDSVDGESDQGRRAGRGGRLAEDGGGRRRLARLHQGPGRQPPRAAGVGSRSRLSVASRRTSKGVAAGRGRIGPRRPDAPASAGRGPATTTPGVRDLMKQILCYGDSNTWGADPADDSRRFEWPVRWPGVLQRELGRRLSRGGGRARRTDDRLRRSSCAGPERHGAPSLRRSRRTRRSTS